MRNAIIGCLLVCAACGSKKDEPGAPPASSSSTQTGAPAAPAPVAGGSAGAAAAGSGSGSAGGSAAAAAGSAAGTAGGAMAAPGVPPGVPPDRKTRIFDCAFSKLDGEGKDRKAVFKLKNLGDRAAAGAQSWIYYYDQADKLLSRYPHRFSTKLEPGATEEQPLGHTGTSIPKGAAKIECEISEVEWKDKTRWANGNLASHAIERPRGGFSHDQLIEREGERVTATWTGKNVDGPVLALKNVSGRPLTVKVVWVYQYDAKGKQLERSVSNAGIDLEPGAQVEQKLGPKGLRAGTKYVEAVVSEVRFRDRDNEQWLNDNLAPLGDRPMAAQPTP
jgi:hypothetical protein